MFQIIVILVYHYQTSEELAYQHLLFQIEGEGCNSSLNTPCSTLLCRMQSGYEYNLKAHNNCFKLGENATETYEMPQTAYGLTCSSQ